MPGENGTTESNKGATKTFTQEELDHVVQDRLSREKAKYSDYETLKTKVSEYEKSQDEKQLKLLEEQKKYDEALKVHNTKLSEYQGLVVKKDLEIQDMKISGALDTEINRQNAYAEETKALLKSQAVLDKEGNIRIKGRDANGIEVFDSVEEGVKKFLTSRPHLVKANNKNGGGTGAGNPNNQNVGGDDLNSLNAALMEAQSRRDVKAQKEINIKIRGKLASMGVRV
jgi:hypothetical protein